MSNDWNTGRVGETESKNDKTEIAKQHGTTAKVDSPCRRDRKCRYIKDVGGKKISESACWEKQILNHEKVEDWQNRVWNDRFAEVNNDEEVKGEN